MIGRRHGWRALLALALGLVGAIGPASAVSADGGPRLVLFGPPFVVAQAGGRSLAHAELWNLGTRPETDPVFIHFSVPPGVFVTDLPPNCTHLPFGHNTGCFFPAGLKPGHADRVTITIAVGNGMRPGILTTSEVTAGTSRTDAANSPWHFPLIVLP